MDEYNGYDWEAELAYYNAYTTGNRDYLEMSNVPDPDNDTDPTDSDQQPAYHPGEQTGSYRVYLGKTT